MCPSWTDVSVDIQQEIPQETVVPAKKGVRSSPCFGEILSVHGKYGWIRPLQQIDHKDTGKHEGRIYLKIKDMRPGCVARAHSIVKFYLYADRAGLGAEDCHAVAERTSGNEQSKWQQSWQPKSWNSWQEKSWQKPWQKPWEQKSWNKWESRCERSEHWRASARPQPLMMVSPEQLLQSQPVLVASHLCAPRVGWPSADQTWLADTAGSEDDSTSAGDSASDLDQSEFFVAPPPGLASPIASDLDHTERFVLPPPGLESPRFWGLPPPPGLELCA
jgi:hypothetical protein